MRRGIRLALICIGVALALIGGGYFYFLTYSPDRTNYPVRGIDISHHQGLIDWSKVAADDVAFAYVKATEGGDYVDDRFAENFSAARSAGLAVGAYHFFTLCRPGAEQAKNFLATVPVEGRILAPAIDLEYEGNCGARPAPEIVRDELNAFLAPVEAAFGREAIFYMTYGFYDTYAEWLPQRPLWTRWIAWHPSTDDWLIWQYHDRGRVDGISVDVDLNVLNGGLGELALLTLR